MRSFLVKGKKPMCKWGMIPPNTFFEGSLPEGYKLAISPGDNYIILDIDRHGNIDGFENIPMCILSELDETFSYSTKNNGKHVWMKYSGNKPLGNKTSGVGIDLRVGDKGYCVYYHNIDIRKCLHLIKDTSKNMNIWLEKLFSFKE